jgi:nucleoside-diphosphate-sugar epimerase
MKNVLVTGATGFIGSHLVKALLKNSDYKVYCLSRDIKKAGFLELLGAVLIEGDISDRSIIDKLNGYCFDLVFHCAASVEDNSIKRLRKANVEGTINICEFSLQHNVKRFIYLSSVAVVSANEDVPLREDLPYAATNNYGISKIEAEKIVLEYRNRGLPSVILRPPIVYGEDEPHGMRKLFFLLKHRLLPLVNEGGSKFHLVYVENVVAAILYSIDNDEFLSGTYFVADKEVLTVRQVFSCFCRGLKVKTPFSLPPVLEYLLLRLPVTGGKFKFFTKDRVYSNERIFKTGFLPPFEANDALIKSTRILYYGK